MQRRPYQLQQRAVPPVQNLGYSQSPQVQHFAPALQNRGSYPGQPQSASSSTVHSPYGSQPSPRQMSASIPQQLSRAPTPSSQQGYPSNRTSMPPPGRAGSPESDRKGKGREDQYLDLNNRAAPIKLAGLVKRALLNAG